MTAVSGEGVSGRTLGRAALWSTATEVTSRLIPAVVFVALARILTPQDFGVIAAGMAVVTLGQALTEAGLTQALVQRDAGRNADVDEASDVCFWSNLALGVLVGSAIVVTSAQLANLFDEPRLRTVLPVLGLYVPIVSVSSVHVALLQRRLAFRQIFVARAIGSVVPGMLSIPLALAGAGPWALVAGALGGAMVTTALLWRGTRWRPRRRFDRALAMSMYAFGLWSSAEVLLSWAIGWFDVLIIGANLPTEAVGLYRTGNQFVLLIFAVLLSPLHPVLFAALSRMQSEPERFRSMVLRANAIQFAVGAPVGVGLFLCGDQIAAVVFGDEWVGVGEVVRWLGLMHGLAWAVGANAEGYRAIGRPHVSVALLALAITTYIPVVLLASQGGLNDAVVARASCGFAMIVVFAAVGDRLLRVGPLELLAAHRATLSGLAVMAAVLWPLRAWFDDPAIGDLGVAVLGGAAAFAATFWIVDRPFASELVGQVRSSLRRGSAG